ncbi:hypothetical protein ACJDT4_05970 [Clostridium neuense]|uniref:Uncharacterized protein n=1 Tax=Clostridium neuense TaxID=1728934 RepID=A0ABW8TBP9_9CLOT
MSKLKIFGIGILIFIVLTGLGFATGEIQAIYNRTVGVDVSSSETDKFHASKGYVDGMIQDLSKYKLELAQTTDSTARHAIISHINEEFSNFDENKIKNQDLKQFLIDVRNDNIK